MLRGHSLVAASRGYSLAAVSRLLAAAASCCGAQALRCVSFSSCGTWPPQLWLPGLVAEFQSTVTHPFPSPTSRILLAPLLCTRHFRLALPFTSPSRAGTMWNLCDLDGNKGAPCSPTAFHLQSSCLISCSTGCTSG